ncbi:hypothetical protein OAJ94_00540 [Deltaproteobacteria bacterium]|nr:hypothetical protein [Deltaproteobacteria bacterium]
MGKITSAAFVFLLIAHLAPVSAESGGRGDTDPIEFPQVNGMVLDQLNLNTQDLDFSPELTAPTPDGGIVALLGVGGHDGLESYTFGDLEIQSSSLEGTNFPEGELCSTYGWGGGFWEGGTGSLILLWMNNNGEAYQMRELNLSNLPTPGFEWSMHSAPCRDTPEPIAMNVRSDGLIGISFIDTFDWYDGLNDGYQLVSGYYDELSGSFDMGTVYMPGLPNEKCYNPVLQEYATNISEPECGFEFIDYGNGSTDCHDYYYENIYYDISEFECQSFLWVPSGESYKIWGVDGMEDNHDANDVGDPYFVHYAYWGDEEVSSHLSFFGDDRIILTYGNKIRWMEIDEQPEYGWGNGLGQEILPMAEKNISDINSLDCRGTSCVFTSVMEGDTVWGEGWDETSIFSISNSMIIESVWSFGNYMTNFNISEITSDTNYNYYISGTMEETTHTSENYAAETELRCSHMSGTGIDGNKMGFVVSFDSNFNVNWGSCSASGTVYPFRLASNGYGDIAMIGRYTNSVNWGNQEVEGVGEGFILLLNDSNGEINHLWEVGDRVLDQQARHGASAIHAAGSGEFWWPFVDVGSGDTGGIAKIGIDDDDDTISKYLDNCPEIVNPSQLDSDSDGFGDDCDAFVSDITQWSDMDGDGFGDSAQGNQPDNCPSVSGTSDEDRNGCPDRDDDGWSDPDEDWTSEDGADQEPDDPQSHVDTTPPTVGFNWQVSDEDDQGGNISVQITWSNSDWSGLTEANTPDTLQIFASAERWDDCSILQMVLEIKLDSQSEPPTSLLIGNLTNDAEHTVCITISDINNNKFVKGPEYVTPTINQPPEYNGGLTAQNIDYGDSWKIDLCVYFTDEETDCGNMTFTPSTNKISINTQELTAEWVPTASDNILENITISATDGKGSTVESNIFTIEVKVQPSSGDVLFTLDVPVMGEVAVSSEQLLGTLGSILAFGGTIGIAVVKLRSRRSKEKLVKRLSDEITNSDYEEDLDEMMEEVEDALNKRKISDDQYSTLSIKINSARNRLAPSSSQHHDYNMPMNNAPVMTQHPPNNAARPPPQYPPMQAPSVATPNANIRGEFNGEGFETLEYPAGSNNWFYRDQNTGQWMTWQ